MRKEYANSTYIETRMPWGVIVKVRALCPDGAVRTCKRVAQTADTFFSIPASVTVKGRTVAGYVTVETMQGLSTHTTDDPLTVKFIAYQYRRNASLLPDSAFRSPLANP